MKFALSGLALACALGARASFDLMLLPGSDERIYRYDPVNRLLLGSYATAGTGMIAADIQGRSYTTAGGSSLQIQEYSSGNHSGYLTALSTNKGVELNGNAVYTLSSTQIKKIVTATNSATFIPLSSSVTWHTFASFGTNMVAIGLSTSNLISFQNVDLTTSVVGALVTTTNTATASSSMGKAAIVANPFTGTPTILFSFLNGANASFARMQLTASGAATSTAVTTGALNNFTSTNFLPGFSAGHAGGFWAYGQDSITPTNARITRYDMAAALIEGESNSFNNPGGAFGPGIFHAANVIAPEPGVFLGLGLGVVGFLRRRK